MKTHNKNCINEGMKQGKTEVLEERDIKISKKGFFLLRLMNRLEEHSPDLGIA